MWNDHVLALGYGAIVDGTVRMDRLMAASLRWLEFNGENTPTQLLLEMGVRRAELDNLYTPSQMTTDGFDALYANLSTTLIKENDSPPRWERHHGINADALRWDGQPGSVLVILKPRVTFAAALLAPVRRIQDLFS